MAESEGTIKGVEQAKVTLAQAEAKLRAATNATERVEAQKLVRAAEEEMKQAEAAAAATAASTAESTPAPAPQVKTHVVQKGESLSLIAKQYYGDVHKWKQIYEANKALIGDNPDVIQPGQELVIPD